MEWLAKIEASGLKSRRIRLEEKDMLKHQAIALGLSAALLGGLELAIAPAVSPGEAAQLSDGTVAFTVPPRLIEAVTTRNRVSERNATYYLTLDLPAGAEEPLQKLEIRLDEGRANLLRFNLDDTQAFTGDRHSQGASLPLGEVVENPDTKTLTITFDPPVAPGQLVTIALHPARNPRFEGTYLFGVTAFPQGDRPQSYFSGYARLSFYSDDRDPFLGSQNSGQSSLVGR